MAAESRPQERRLAQLNHLSVTNHYPGLRQIWGARFVCIQYAGAHDDSLIRSAD